VAFYLLGALTGLIITHIYYVKAMKDSADALIAQRVSVCSDMEKSFLIALYSRPISKWAMLTIRQTHADGSKVVVAVAATTLIQMMQQHIPYSIEYHYPRPPGIPIGCTHPAYYEDPNFDDDNAPITLSNRGIENALYLIRNHFNDAKVVVIDDTDETRGYAYQATFGQEPRGAPALTRTQSIPLDDNYPE
jgi:hypothetical protein